eukprot:UN00202
MHKMYPEYAKEESVRLPTYFQDSINALTDTFTFKIQQRAVNGTYFATVFLFG